MEYVCPSFTYGWHLVFWIEKLGREVVGMIVMISQRQVKVKEQSKIIHWFTCQDHQLRMLQ